MVRGKGAVALVVAAAFLAGCSALLKEKPGVSYARSVTQLGIFPVYPPREDLQVGDIYAVENDQKLEAVHRRSAFVRSLNLTNEIRRYLDGRYQFADTAAFSSNTVILTGTAAKSIPAQKDAPAGGEVLDTSDLQHLPLTSFPSIEVDSGMSIGVQGAFSSLGAVFGFAAAKTLKMTLDFGGVTSYSVPVPIAYDRLDQFCGTPDSNGTFPPRECTEDWLKFYIGQKFQVGKSSIKTAVPVMVSKVYLARAISYTFNDTTMAAAAAALAADKNSKAPAVVGNDLLTSAVAGGKAEMVTALAAFQTSLNQTVNNSQNANGVSVSISSFTRNTVTFEELFQRPVVIGYEAVYKDLSVKRK